MSDRRPYRVVFSASPSDSANSRRGTIVVRDADSAHHEARTIARTGRTAEVQYVTEDGSREVIAVYEPDEVA